MNSQTLTVPEQADLKTQTVDELLDGFFKYLDLLVSTSEITSTTRDTYRHGIRRFIQWLSKSQVSDEVVREWIKSLREKHYTPNTINTWLSGVRAFFVWCARNRRTAYDPTRGVRSVKRSGQTSIHLREALSDDEVVRLIDSIDTIDKEGKRNKAMIALMAFCGCRQSDICNADLYNLKRESGKLVLRVRGKGRREADEIIVIASEEAEGYLKDYLNVRVNGDEALFVSYSDRSMGKRLSSSAVRRITKEYFKMAGIEDRKTTHGLRHAAATNALKHGAPLNKVQSMLRHKNINTTLIYAKEVDRITNPAEEFIDFRNQKEKP